MYFPSPSYSRLRCPYLPRRLSHCLSSRCLCPSFLLRLLRLLLPRIQLSLFSSPIIFIMHIISSPPTSLSPAFSLPLASYFLLSYPSPFHLPPRSFLTSFYPPSYSLPLPLPDQPPSSQPLLPNLSTISLHSPSSPSLSVLHDGLHCCSLLFATNCSVFASSSLRLPRAPPRRQQVSPSAAQGPAKQRWVLVAPPVQVTRVLWCSPAGDLR